MARNAGIGNVVAVLVAGCGLMACTSQQANTTGSGGGGAGPGGRTGTGGSGGASTTSEGTLCPPPAATGLITDFTYVAGDAGTAADTTMVSFGDSTTTLSGGEFIYPTTGTYPLTSTVTGNNWHITGTVGDYSGLGFVFYNCNRINATGFTGISFKISGMVQTNAITFEVDTLTDAITPSWLNTHGGTAMVTDPGACKPPETATLNQYSQSTCGEPTKSIPVTATPTTVTVHWSDFTTGKPDPGPKPADIVGIRWVLPTPAGVGLSAVATYAVDITIDDVTFVK